VFAITDNHEARLETIERRLGMDVGAMPAVVVVARPRRPAPVLAAPRAPRVRREHHGHHRHH
jgi:hypothetical protein